MMFFGWRSRAGWWRIRGWCGRTAGFLRVDTARLGVGIDCGSSTWRAAAKEEIVGETFVCGASGRRVGCDFLTYCGIGVLHSRLDEEIALTGAHLGRQRGGNRRRVEIGRASCRERV